MIKRLKCSAGYHDYYLLMKLSSTSRKLGCKNCAKCFAMNDDVKVVLDWDDDFDKLYRVLGVL